MFSRAQMRALAEANGEIAPEDIDFMLKLAYRSGLSDRTAVVPAIQRNMDHRPGIEAAREEFEVTCFSAAEEALRKARVAPSEVRYVITNSSLFNPTPSLSAALINRFGMPETTVSYSLGGMGCSGERFVGGLCFGAPARGSWLGVGAVRLVRVEFGVGGGAPAAGLAAVRERGAAAAGRPGAEGSGGPRVRGGGPHAALTHSAPKPPPFQLQPKTRPQPA
jgi:hypothetical protein